MLSQISIKLSVCLLCLIILFGSCNNISENSAIVELKDSIVQTDETVRKAVNIFYHMYLPSEMYKVFERVGSLYNPEILNPVENVNIYITSSKAALNLGIYGVDLSYNKIFGQDQKTLLYYTVIHKLSQQLGIPDYHFLKSMKQMENNFINRDSITKYASDVYYTAHQYLNKNERQSTAALIILGGWIEALYIASRIADENNNNIEITERIASQKYSLKSLIALLNNYTQNETVVYYVNMLKILKQSYDKVEIYYEEGDLKIDKKNKFIIASDIKVNMTIEDINEIKSIVTSIRNEIVN